MFSCKSITSIIIVVFRGYLIYLYKRLKLKVSICVQGNKTLFYKASNGNDGVPQLCQLQLRHALQGSKSNKWWSMSIGNFWPLNWSRFLIHSMIIMTVEQQFYSSRDLWHSHWTQLLEPGVKINILRDPRWGWNQVSSAMKHYNTFNSLKASYWINVKIIL